MSLENISVTFGYSPLPTSEVYTNDTQPEIIWFFNDPKAEATVKLLNYSVPINGYINPIVILFTLITNSLVCLILLKPNMRSPTNMLLVFMAVSDTLTGLSPLPWYVYYYLGDNYSEYIPYGWCDISSFLSRALPTVFHTVSIWLTLALAIQRYIYVCHFILAKKLCTTNNVIKTSAAIFVVSCVFHFILFVDPRLLPQKIESAVEPNKTILTCRKETPTWIIPIWGLFYQTYYWARVILIHVIPCVTLVVINGLLIRTMQEAKKRRMQLLQQNRKSECRKLKDSNCTTMMMVAVVGVFLIVEFPSAIVSGMFILDNTFNIGIISQYNFDKSSLLVNLGILISYPVNFFIYAGMSRQFRETFKRLFCKGPLPLDREHSQYSALANENGRSANTCTTAI